MILFSCIEEVREFVKYNLNFDFETLTPFLDDAEYELGKRYVNEAFLERLRTASVNPTEVERQALVFARRYIARTATVAWLPFGEVQFGNDGITTVGKGEVRTSAYDAQIARITHSLESSAYKALEQLLTWLETTNIIEEFEEYANSEQRLENRRYLIKSAIEFSKYYQIFGEELTFQALRPTMAAIETQQLAPALGEQYELLKAAVSLSDDQKKLLDMSKWYLAYATIANALELEMNVELNAGGLRVNYTTQFQNTKYFTPPTDAQRSSAQQAAARRADTMWGSIGAMMSVIYPPTEVLDTGNPVIEGKSIVSL
jgi:hypothetical protein